MWYCVLANILEVQCLKSVVWVTWIDGVRNNEVCRSVRIERELVGNVNQKVFTWFGHMQRKGDYHVCTARRVSRVEDCACFGQTEVRLDG